MFYPSQIIKNKETGEVGSYIKTTMKKNDEDYMIKIMLISGNTKIQNIDKWEAV